MFDLTDDAHRPLAHRGDQNWAVEFAGDIPRTQRAIVQRDIRDYAIEVLRLNNPDCSLDLIRCGGRSRGISPIRRNLIAALSTAGYRIAPSRACSSSHLPWYPTSPVSSVATSASPDPAHASLGRS